jgi:hypothetical protein
MTCCSDNFDPNVDRDNASAVRNIQKTAKPAHSLKFDNQNYCYKCFHFLLILKV